jgi:hypothetical protein
MHYGGKTIHHGGITIHHGGITIYNINDNTPWRNNNIYHK